MTCDETLKAAVMTCHMNRLIRVIPKDYMFLPLAPESPYFRQRNLYPPDKKTLRERSFPAAHHFANEH